MKNEKVDIKNNWKKRYQQKRSADNADMPRTNSNQAKISKEKVENKPKESTSVYNSSMFKGSKIKVKLQSIKNKIFENKIFLKIKEIYRKFESTNYGRIIIKVVNIGVFLLAIYFILFPIVPAIFFKLFYENKEFYPYETKLIDQSTSEGTKGIPQENRIVIPSINVDMPIVEGSSEDSLNVGVWHRPNTGAPGSGNMVLTGHRFGYAFLPTNIKAATSFYNLDKLGEGDKIIIYWNKSEYDYEVYKTEVVAPSDTYIENPTQEHILTLYTCHPLGSVDKRLVVLAKPI